MIYFQEYMRKLSQVSLVLFNKKEALKYCRILHHTYRNKSVGYSQHSKVRYRMPYHDRSTGHELQAYHRQNLTNMIATTPET